jgi:hypothetical protein
MVQRHRLVFGVVVAACVAALGLAAVVRANNDDGPSNRQIAFAKDVSALMLNEVVAALFKEFDETTPANVEHGKQAISLIFNDLNRDMRLVGAFSPLLGGANNRPSDRFETAALKRALDGDSYAAVVKINDTWYYRTSTPLNNKMHTACVLCHTGFTDDFFNSTNNPEQRVGTLILSVPIRTNNGHH